MSAQGCYPGYVGDPIPSYYQPPHYPPSWQQYRYTPTTTTAVGAAGCMPLQPLTEQRIREIIREIIREELRAALAGKESP